MCLNLRIEEVNQISSVFDKNYLVSKSIYINNNSFENFVEI